MDIFEKMELFRLNYNKLKKVLKELAKAVIIEGVYKDKWGRYYCKYCSSKFSYKKKEEIVHLENCIYLLAEKNLKEIKEMGIYDVS